MRAMSELAPYTAEDSLRAFRMLTDEWTLQHLSGAALKVLCMVARFSGGSRTVTLELRAADVSTYTGLSSKAARSALDLLHGLGYVDRNTPESQKTARTYWLARTGAPVADR